MVESVTRGLRLVSTAEFSGHVDERNRGDDVLDRYCVEERKAEEQTVIDFVNRIAMAL